MAALFGNDSSEVELPLIEGTVRVAPDRVLGFAEFGDPNGDPCFWFHGTPGARRQVAPLARQAAAERGVRLVCIERPGSGVSTPHRYGRVRDFADDIVHAADSLGFDRFAAVGLSGGGPYTLACAATLPDRIVGVGILGGVAPAVGDEAAEGGPVALTKHVSRLLDTVEAPLHWGLRRLLLAAQPFQDQAYNAFRGLMPEGDQRVFDADGVREMFLDDMGNGLREGGIGAALRDLVLFGRDWGFQASDISVPVHWWHGDEDTIVPLAHGEHMATLIPHAEFVVREGDSHLSGYAAADDVIQVVASLFEPPPRRRAPRKG